MPQASALVGGRGWGAGVSPAGPCTAGILPASCIATALILLPLCVSCIGPALGNIRQSQPGQAGNVKAGQSSQSTTAKASDGISESPTHRPTRFVTAIASDGQGGVWVSGEDFGIYHGMVRDAIGAKARARAKKAGALPRFHWQHFDVANSPGLAGNSITALCVDGQGRLWVGTNRRIGSCTTK